MKTSTREISNPRFPIPDVESQQGFSPTELRQDAPAPVAEPSCIESQRGFSLMELLISTALLTIILGLTFNMLPRDQKSFDAEQASADAQQNARFAINRLAEIIRGAGNNPAGISTINSVLGVGITGGTVDPNGNIVGGTTIRIKSDLNGNKNLTDTISSDADVVISSEDVSIYRSGTNIVMVDNNSSTIPVPLAEDIQDLKFDFSPDQKLVTVHVTARSTRTVADGQARTSSLTSHIRLRNR